MKAEKDVKLDQLSAGFERGILALDELRLMQLVDGLRLQGAQNQVQIREYKRLERKYGKEHTRTLNAAAKIALGKEQLRAMSIVHAAASAPRPDPGNGWAVDGFVRTANGDPVGGVAVAAYDRQDRWCKDLGYACTDDHGYFSIRVEKLSEKLSAPLFMRASKNKKLLESNEVQIAPKPKSADRVEIIIVDIAGTGVCVPPVGGKAAPRPPEEPAGGKEKPAAPVKEEPAPGAAAKGVSKETSGAEGLKVKGDVESKKKVPEKESKKLKGKTSKPDAASGLKRSGPKQRGK